MHPHDDDAEGTIEESTQTDDPADLSPQFIFTPHELNGVWFTITGWMEPKRKDSTFVKFHVVQWMMFNSLLQGPSQFAYADSKGIDRAAFNKWVIRFRDRFKLMIPGQRSEDSREAYSEAIKAWHESKEGEEEQSFAE